MTKSKMTIRENVELVLMESVESRNNDKKLILEYWKSIDGITMSNFESEFISKGTMPESIRRARQLIQEEGKYLPTEDVVKARRGKQISMENAIVNHREVV